MLDRWPEDIAVPAIAKQPLALATPRFLLARSAFELRALQTAPELTPAASRRLRKTDRLLVEIEYYSAGRRPSSWPSCSIRRASRWSRCPSRPP